MGDWVTPQVELVSEESRQPLFPARQFFQAPRAVSILLQRASPGNPATNEIATLISLKTSSTPKAHALSELLLQKYVESGGGRLTNSRKLQIPPSPGDGGRDCREDPRDPGQTASTQPTRSHQAATPCMRISSHTFMRDGNMLLGFAMCT